MFFCVLFEGLQTSFKMPLQFSLVYFLVVLLSVNFAHGIKPANVEIEQLKVLYQSMSAKLQNVEYENQRLNSEVTRLQTRSTSVAFTARLSNDTELAAIETVVFDNILLNSGNAYNERNGQFTAPVAGTYQFAVSLTNFGKESHFAVQKNGNDALSRLYIKSGLTYSTSSVVIAHLDAGDIVHVQSQYFPTNLRQGKYSVFSGFLIK